jgi:hypothetical protein
MPAQTKSKLPAPIYAAAGASDLLYQRLRKVEFDKVAEFARDAQERAVAVYRDLVARGEKVVKGKTPVRVVPTAVDTRPAAADAPKPVKRTRAAVDK